MSRGFTLLELLIVIGILAILSTTMILVINPAEMLRKARDSQRISDLNNLKSAISLYLTDVLSPNVGASNTIYTHMTSGASLSTCISGASTVSSSTARVITGSGWIPISFSSITGGSPISAEPIDPNPSTSPKHLYYAYYPWSSSTFELLANMESTYYSNGSSGDVESKDGGTNNYLYEVGNYLGTITTSTCYGSATP
jgi:prepilin-type N-terminal cleavage/methylation domain-containing protein